MLERLEKIYRELPLALAQRRFRSMRADFYEDMAEALNDDGELAPEIAKYMARYSRRRADRGLAMMFGLWLRRMDTMPFADAVKGTIPDMDVMILSTMETSGRLGDGLTFLADAVRTADAMRASMRKAVATPILIAIVLTIVLVIFSIFLIPVMSSLYPHERWPIAGQCLYYLSRIVMGGGPIIAVVVLVAAKVFRWSLGNWTGPRRDWWDRRLPYSIYRDYAGGIFLVTFASLLNSGMATTEALRKMSGTATPWLRYHINRMMRALDSTPDKPGRALNTGIFSQRLADRIEDFASRGNFNDAINKVGIQGVKKVIQSVDVSSSALNKLSTVIAGALLGVMILGVFQTGIYADADIKQQMRRKGPG